MARKYNVRESGERMYICPPEDMLSR
jgi:hypothetical protein